MIYHLLLDLPLGMIYHGLPWFRTLLIFDHLCHQICSDLQGRTCRRMRSSVASWHQEITVTRCDSAKARDGCSMKRQSIGKDTSTWQRQIWWKIVDRIHWNHTESIGYLEKNQPPKNTPGKAAHGKVSVGWRVVRDPKRIVAGPDYSHLPAKDTRSNVPEKKNPNMFWGCCVLTSQTGQRRSWYQNCRPILSAWSK